MMQHQNKEFVPNNRRRMYVDCETRRVVIKVVESTAGMRERELCELISEFLAHRPLTPLCGLLLAALEVGPSF
jgi:hypothetical protein